MEFLLDFMLHESLASERRVTRPASPRPWIAALRERQILATPTVKAFGAHRSFILDGAASHGEQESDPMAEDLVVVADELSRFAANTFNEVVALYAGREPRYAIGLFGRSWEADKSQTEDAKGIECKGCLPMSALNMPQC